jgi:hypothetical protein
MHTCTHDSNKEREKLKIHRTAACRKRVCLTILKKASDVELQLAGR